MTDEEKDVLTRAAEAGCYLDLTGRWLGNEDGEVPPSRNDEDTEILRELHRRASDLLGRDLPSDEEALALLLEHTVYLTVLQRGERVDHSLRDFAFRRFHDKPWRLL